MSERPSIIPELVAAEAMGRPCVINGIPHVLVPPDYNLANLERTMGFPARKRGSFKAKDAASFNTLVELLRPLADESLPLFYARSGTSATVTGVLNFSTWRDLIVVLEQRLSDPFQEWFKLDKVPQGQRQFALFLEERTQYVVKPEGAALLELARKFKANVSVRFQSVVENDNGDNSLEFVKTTEAGSAEAKSRMKVPDVITLEMPVWHGSRPVRFHARFSYSISQDGKLGMGFEILGLNALLSEQLHDIVLGISKEHENCVIVEGESDGVRGL